jgi:hypothetical protein
MTILAVETYVIKPDKMGEYTAFFKKFMEWVKKNPDLFKEVKSFKLFSHMLGGKYFTYVEMWELENLADFEKLGNRLEQSEYVTRFRPEGMSLVVPGTLSLEIWNSVM